MTVTSTIVGIILLFLALGLQPTVRYVRELSKAPPDPHLGTIEILSPAELASFYANRRTLIIGGTRGVGKGTAEAIVKAGGHVTVVGRSAASGAKTVEYLQGLVKNRGSQQIKFIPGDLGSIRTSKELVRRLQEVAQREGKFDYLAMTAMVFPEWKDLLQEDGLERAHFVGIVGRYVVYRHMDLFLKEGARVLNVFATGQKQSTFDRDLLTATRNITGLIETLMSSCGAHEVMMIGLQDSAHSLKTTKVNTHPGILGTDLHDGQGWAMDFFEPIMVALLGISEEDCGVRQASILASPRLYKDGLSYVDEDMEGRLRPLALQENADKHKLWLMGWLNEKSGL